MKTGDKVKFTNASNEQVNWGSNDDPRKVLEMNATYEVEEVDVHSWHTKVSLKGIKGRFNSVHFKVISDKPEKKLITHVNKDGVTYTLDDLKQTFNAGRLYEAGELEIDSEGYLTVFDAWLDKLHNIEK